MLNKKLDLKRLLFSMASLVDLGQEATSSKDLSAKMKAALYVITGMFSVPTRPCSCTTPSEKCSGSSLKKGAGSGNGG